MTKQLPARRAQRTWDAKVAAYQARFATMSREEQERHLRITAKYAIALLLGSKTPLIDCVRGESEAVQRKAREFTAIDAGYTVEGFEL